MLDTKHRSVMNHMVNKEEMFAKPAISISRRKAYEMIRNNTSRYWRIKTQKLSGASYNPMFKNGPFPGGSKGPVYNYRAKGYWVGYDGTAGNWRTIVLKNVERFKVGQQWYKIK